AANSSCSYPFEVGLDYLVFAYAQNANLYTNNCAGTRPAASETALIRELQSARAGTSMADLFGSTYSHRLDATSAAGLMNVEALAGLVVTARSEHSEHEIVTGPDGFYEFWRLPPGRYVITAKAPAGRHITQSHTLDVGLGTACRAYFDVQYD